MVAYVRTSRKSSLTSWLAWALRVSALRAVWRVILGDGITQDKKIAALGMRVSRNTTMHGFAINCATTPHPSSSSIPCGISDAGVPPFREQLGRTITPPIFWSRWRRELESARTAWQSPFGAHLRRRTKRGVDAVKKHRTGRHVSVRLCSSYTKTSFTYA